MKRIFALAAAAALCLSLAACGGECKHEWKEADCENPKTCALCQETQGEALGHDLGDWEKTDADYVNAKQNYERKCLRCGKVVEVRSGELDLLHDGEFMHLTAEGLAERMNQVFSRFTDVKIQAEAVTGQENISCTITMDGEPIAQLSLENNPKEQSPLETGKFRAIICLVYAPENTGPVVISLIQAMDPTVNMDQAAAMSQEVANLAKEGFPFENNGIIYMAEPAAEGYAISVVVKSASMMEQEALAHAHEHIHEHEEPANP